MISATTKITHIAYWHIPYYILRIGIFRIPFKVKFNVTLKGCIYKRATGVYHGQNEYPVKRGLGNCEVICAH